jgi:hypothetical protein
MYYKEDIIGGILCFAVTPNGGFREFTARELTEKVKDLEAEVKQLKLLAGGAASVNNCPPDLEFVEWACKRYKLMGRNRWIHKRDDLGVEEAYMTSEELYKHYLSIFCVD